MPKTKKQNQKTSTTLGTVIADFRYDNLKVIAVVQLVRLLLSLSTSKYVQEHSLG